ncbi:hypothetical protein WDU94_005209, partial [Cyamophila willieti]
MTRFELLEVGPTLSGLSPSPNKKSYWLKYCTGRIILLYILIIATIVIIFAVHKTFTGESSYDKSANHATPLARKDTPIVVDNRGKPLNSDVKGYTIENSRNTTEHGIELSSTSDQTVPHQGAENVTQGVNPVPQGARNTSNQADCSQSGEGTSCKESTIGISKVCYFTNYAVYHEGLSGNFQAEDIDFSLCNFILYASAHLDNDTYKVTLSDTWADLPDNGGYGHIGKILSRANSTGAKVLISLGGWDDSAKPAYSTLFTNDTLQNTFVQDMVAFIKKYGFQGLDFDYNYPQCPQGKCHPGDSEKIGFSNLIVKLRTEFDKHQFYLTASVYTAPDTIDKYYQAKVLNDNLDWLGMMTYDYHISTEPAVGLVAPLFQYGTESLTSNVKASVEAWLKRGVAANKLVLGVPMYGVSYTLADNTKHTISSPTAKADDGDRPFYYYNEICGFKSQGWTVVTSENGKPVGGTYAY